MSDLINNRYILALSGDKIIVFDIDNNLSSDILYKNIHFPKYFLKVNEYEYFFICEKIIYLMKFENKKFETIKRIDFGFGKDYEFSEIYCKNGDNKYIIEVKNNNLKSDHLKEYVINKFFIVFKLIKN